MDFSQTVTLAKVKKWLSDNRDRIEKTEENDIRTDGFGLAGFRLNINRPSWFASSRLMSADERISIIESNVYTGKSLEEVFIKIYEECLLHLTWKGGKKDGKPVDLMDYFRSYNDTLVDCVRFHHGTGKYIVYPDLKEAESREEESEVEEDSDEAGTSESDNSNEEASEEYIVIEESTREKYEPVILQWLINNKLDFYGFTGNGCDCCFSVTELTIK